MSDDRNSSIGWFLAGLGLGAAVGILYAPKSGRETRETLLSSADEGREFVTQRSRELALQALALDPTVDDLAIARAVLDDYLETHKAHLPQFHGRWHL